MKECGRTEGEHAPKNGGTNPPHLPLSDTKMKFMPSITHDSCKRSKLYKYNKYLLKPGFQEISTYILYWLITQILITNMTALSIGDKTFGVQFQVGRNHLKTWHKQNKHFSRCMEVLSQALWLMRPQLSLIQEMYPNMCDRSTACDLC